MKKNDTYKKGFKVEIEPQFYGFRSWFVGSFVLEAKLWRVLEIEWILTRGNRWEVTKETTKDREGTCQGLIVAVNWPKKSRLK